MPETGAPPTVLEGNPDIGGAVGCEKCPRILEVPDLDWRSVKTPAETYAVLSATAENHGWKHGVFMVSGVKKAVFTCPACITQAKESIEQLLPRFNANANCGACGHDQIDTSHCRGLNHSCPFDAARNHLHRTCKRCGRTWIEGCLDDPKTKDAQCTESFESPKARTQGATLPAWWKAFARTWSWLSQKRKKMDGLSPAVSNT